MKNKSLIQYFYLLNKKKANTQIFQYVYWLFKFKK
jgi:hypothetical protein